MSHASPISDSERISNILRSAVDVKAGSLGSKIVEDHVESSSVSRHVDQIANGNFQEVLESPLAQVLLGHGESPSSPRSNGSRSDFVGYIAEEVDEILKKEVLVLQDGESLQLQGIQQSVFLVGLASLSAFLQSTVTGPPLPFASESIIFSSENYFDVAQTRQSILSWLGADGVAPYALIPNVELFYLAKIIFNHQSLTSQMVGAVRQRVRVNFLHQRLLSEEVSSLQDLIYEDLKTLDETILSSPETSTKLEVAEYLLEKAAIHTYYGSDGKAREALDQAAHAKAFEFALTGRLGKRTKFQQTDISQLVVLARSASDVTAEPEAAVNEPQSSSAEANGSTASKPTDLDLNDDTLLESISFTQPSASLPTVVQDEASLSPRLASLEPGNQPALDPLDSIILLSLASSITNTSPSDGLTREETLPYATRVLEGGSTNWQVYTQALLVRSRIEGYRSRTQERGVLQLQALVDQVIAETTTSVSGAADNGHVTSTFLPKAKESETASVNERLRYISQLASPTRWEIEAELAARWISLGGLKTALEIYERLQMWAEVALCYAGLSEEQKAKRIIRKRLFYSSNGDDASVAEDEEKWEGPPRQPSPPEAARYYCILGDIDRDPVMYEKAWEESNGRYARAQRSLGKYYFTTKDYAKSAEAYAKSLKINQLNHGSWYALGCARLQLEQWDGAVEAFARAVQLDEQDAESWSNLAAALLEKEVKPTSALPAKTDDLDPEDTSMDPYRHKKDALKALKQASRLKRDDWRIWENVLIVSASIAPPPFADIVIALRRIIQIRGPTIGERSVDEDVLDLLVRHIINVDAEKDEPTGYDPSKPGLERLIVELVEKDVVPLITASRRLWQIVARLALWRKRPSSALESNEKAWRAVISQPGWETGTEKRWEAVVDATIELADAYESLGEMEKTEGLSAGEGQLVAKDWKFKARSAIRGILGRGKESWEGTEGWDRLKDKIEDLKGT
ncbi:MAG: hypothetical protein M4579_003450 [Chaenotheca gracillima]|nr:MAG: hypothetical protein M4579_003450 [Chaenotheca gracillima]